METLAKSEGASRSARASTLLPLMRKVLGVTLATVVTFTILSELGVNIGPLLASAGVVGIAIGFGAQSLVKDVISGTFWKMPYRLATSWSWAAVKGLWKA